MPFKGNEAKDRGSFNKDTMQAWCFMFIKNSSENKKHENHDKHKHHMSFTTKNSRVLKGHLAN